MVTQSRSPEAWRPAAIWLWTVIVSGAALTFAVLESGDAWRPAGDRAPAPPAAALSASGPAVDTSAPPIQGTPVASPSDPIQLQIPRLGVAAAVEAVGLTSDGRMATPAAIDHVGWYRLGPRPGEMGSAVMDGHLQWYSGPAVFHDLPSIRLGDTIVVLSATTKVTFQVDRITNYAYNAIIPGLFTNQGPPQLSLITCTGGWDAARQVYLRRLLVHATFESKTTNL